MYQYNGKEFQDELGLNWNDYGARNYDPAIGRFMNMDNYAEDYRYINPYQYTLNNPVYFVDVNGDCIDINYGTNQTATFCGDINSLSQEALNNDFVAQTVAAYMILKSSYAAYNKANGTSFSSDFVSLVDSQEHSVKFKHNSQNPDAKSRHHSTYDSDNSTLYWNTNAGLDADGRSFSSLVLLEHEAEHGYHHQTNPGRKPQGDEQITIAGLERYFKEFKGTYFGDSFNDNIDPNSDQEEYNAIAAETRAAKALGELPKNIKTTREKYRNGKYNKIGFGSQEKKVQQEIKKLRDSQPKKKQDVK